MSNLRILVHFPTRGRMEQAERTLRGYHDAEDNGNLITYSFAVNDEADVPIIAYTYLRSKVIVHPFRSKIAAYNAIPPDLEWDIVLAASDDMWCVQQGWDTIIRDCMAAHFPDLDGCLWFSDGRQDRFGLRHHDKEPICTFSIMGRKAYERDGYIYHNDYLSYFCDNEWTEVWGARGKLYADPRCLFRNEHYAWGGVMQEDATYRDGAGHNNIKWKHDKQLYHERKLKGFP